MLTKKLLNSRNNNRVFMKVGATIVLLFLLFIVQIASSSPIYNSTNNNWAGVRFCES